MKLNQWPEPEFVAETLAAFPDKAIANVEEARVSDAMHAETFCHSHSHLPVVQEVTFIRRRFDTTAGQNCHLHAPTHRPLHATIAAVECL